MSFLPNYYCDTDNDWETDANTSNDCRMKNIVVGGLLWAAKIMFCIFGLYEQVLFCFIYNLASADRIVYRTAFVLIIALGFLVAKVLHFAVAKVCLCAQSLILIFKFIDHR